MTYDVFIFFDELDLLEMRLNILNEVVDFFVLTEATTTLMGMPKPMYFAENRERFKNFEKKIIYNGIDTKKMDFADQWQREIYQKNSCIEALADCEDEDIIIYSDLDEIPNPNKISDILGSFNPNIVYHMAQDLFYFFLNYKNIDGTLLAACGEFDDVTEKKWLGSKMCSFKTLKSVGCDELRSAKMINEYAVRISDGGWHFSYMGGTQSSVEERVRKKLGAFSHSEYNKWKYYNRFNIWYSIKKGKDLLGRNARFKKVEIDNSYPSWLIENFSNYPHLVIKQ